MIHYKNSSHNDKFELIKMVIKERRFLGTRIMIGLLASSSMITIFYNTITFSCWLSIIQNVVITFIITALTVSHFGIADLGTRLKRGWWTACIIGAFPATFLVLISNIQYYLDKRIIAYQISGDPLPPLTVSILWAGIGSQIIAWIMLVTISGMVGLLAAVFSSRWQFDD
jgi:Mg/Co/Ni transporter MgtE